MHPLISLFYQAEDFFFKPLSKEFLEFKGGPATYLTGVPSEGLNLFILRNAIPNLGEALDQTLKIFKAHHSVGSAVIPDHFLTKEVEKLLSEKAFKPSETSVAMYLSLSSSSTFCKELPPLIRNVDHNLEEWAKPLLEAFETSPESMAQYREIHEKALEAGAPFYHFSLYENKRPVAALTLSLNTTTKSARLDDVGTLPDYQKKGYASALVVHALEKAKGLGAAQCFLEASESGVSVYQKIGFMPLFNNKIYTFDPPAS